MVGSMWEYINNLVDSCMAGSLELAHVVITHCCAVLVAYCYGELLALHGDDCGVAR